MRRYFSVRGGAGDLTNPDVLASDCYYLKQNDLVYVEPIESKLKNINNSSKQFNIYVISSVII